MKKLLYILFWAALFPMVATAQVKYGFLSYEKAIKSMPEYALVQENLKDLKSKYDAEMKRVEEEFNRKYEEFLDGQKDFAPTILQKRQTELQELMTKNVAFKAESLKLLKQAEADAYLPLREKLQRVLGEIGLERGYAFILNTDGDAFPFVHPDMGEDISQLVREAVR
jgi:outer membrane protein